MSTSINLTFPLQLADASGTVGTFLPEAKLRELTAERDDLHKELDNARHELGRSRQQAEEYERQLNALKAERHDYERALTATVRDQFDFDEDRALALVIEAQTNGADGAEVLGQVEAICESHPGQGTHAD
jgi:chromosome segregation ATPase